MTRRPERAAVRWGVLALLAASCAGAAVVSLNASMSDIPSVAFGSHLVLLRGARWSEEAFGVGDEFLVRQKRAEEKAARADLEIKKEVRLLGEQLKDAGQAQDKLVSQAFERIAALEDVGGR
jgi:hypothetical protein